MNNNEIKTTDIDEEIEKNIYKVLLIDDKERSVQLMKDYLNSIEISFEITYANDGEEGLKKAYKETPDLIITDIMMPKINGYELISTLKKDPDYKHIPIIVISSLAEDRDIDEAITAGASDYLLKPVNFEQLTNKIKKHIQKSDSTEHTDEEQDQLNLSLKSKPGEEELLKNPDVLKQINDLLTAHVSNFAYKQIKEYVLYGKNPPAYKNYLSVLFVDLVGFTEISELIDAGVVLDILNFFFKRIEKTIIKYGGDIDKFIGDALLITFDRAENAVRCGIEILALDLPALNTEFSISEVEDIIVHMGINTGWVIQGNIGTKNRIDTTVIGDGVNVAARIQQISEPNELWISSTTFSELGAIKSHFEQLDRMKLKGKHKHIMIYKYLQKEFKTEKKVLVYETSTEQQNVLRSKLAENNIKKMVFCEKKSEIEDWFNPDHFDAVVLGPSIPYTYLSELKKILTANGGGKTPIIPIIKKELDKMAREMYEKLGLKVFVPLYKDKGWEKIGKVIAVNYLNKIPKKEIEPSSKKTQIYENRFYMEDKELDKAKDRIKMGIKEKFHESRVSESFFKLKIVKEPETIEVIFVKPINLLQMDILRNNIKYIKNYYFSGKKDIHLIYNLELLPKETIAKRFISEILNLIKELGDITRMKIHLLLPEGANTKEIENIKKEYSYNFV